MTTNATAARIVASRAPEGLKGLTVTLYGAVTGNPYPVLITSAFPAGRQDAWAHGEGDEDAVLMVNFKPLADDGAPRVDEYGVEAFGTRGLLAEDVITIHA